MTGRMSKVIDDVMTEIYRSLYASSTPYGDWDKMLETAELNERGQKIIKYNDYEIDEDLYHKIVEDKLNQVKLSKYYKESIKRGILLGCSPRFKEKI